PYQQAADNNSQQKRLIERVRTLYRADDLSAILPLGTVEPLALVGENYKLALTPSLLGHVFKRKHAGQPDEDLLPNPAALLEGQAGARGGLFAVDGSWWVPSGRVFFSEDPNHSAAQELAVAKEHFFLPRRFRDAFGRATVVVYDGPAATNQPRYDLLVTRT